MPHKAVDELLGVALGNVLGHFQALDEVELPTELQGLRQIAGEELRSRNVESVLIDIGPVDSLYLLGPVLQPYRQPHASPTAEVKHAPDGDLVGQMSNDVVSRDRGGAVGRFVEAVVVGVQLSNPARLPAHCHDHEAAGAGCFTARQ